MAGRGATQTSQPTKLQQKKNKSKSKAKDYWVSLFFCVIPYDALKSYKKGKFQIGKKKFETVCYKHLGEPMRETGSYKKRKKYDLPLYVDCSDLIILENCWLDEESFYPHITLTLLDFYQATAEQLKKGEKLNVHFHIGCDCYCDPLRNGLRQVLTGAGAGDIDSTYKRYAQFTREYEKFMDRFKEKEWTFKVDYSACYNLFQTFCPGLVTEHSPVEKKRRKDKQDEPAPIKLKTKEKDPNKPKTKFHIAGQDEAADTPVNSNGQIKVNLIGSDKEIAEKQQQRANQKERTWEEVNADIDREGKKNPNLEQVIVNDIHGVPGHYRNPYYNGPNNNQLKIELL